MIEKELSGKSAEPDSYGTDIRREQLRCGHRDLIRQFVQRLSKTHREGGTDLGGRSQRVALTAEFLDGQKGKVLRTNRHLDSYLEA